MEIPLMIMIIFPIFFYIRHRSFQLGTPSDSADPVLNQSMPVLEMLVSGEDITGLVNIQKAIDMAIYSGFTHSKW